MDSSVNCSCRKMRKLAVIKKGGQDRFFQTIRPWCIDACVVSDKGCVRSDNQDSVFLDVNSGLLCVADGMGGEACGGAYRRQEEPARSTLPPLHSGNIQYGWQAAP